MKQHFDAGGGNSWAGRHERKVGSLKPQIQIRGDYKLGEAQAGALGQPCSCKVSLFIRERTPKHYHTPAETAISFKT
jgi:hypothetical protein